MSFWHFGLFEQPFGAAPDLRFVYNSRSYREALAAFINGIDSGVGFSCLTGEPGLGKTTLLHALLEHYSPVSRTAYIVSAECAPQQFFARILEGFDIHVAEADVNAMYAAFHDMVVAETSAGKRVILVMDDADALSTSTLDTLRLLSNVELSDPRLLHVVLAGTAHLNDTLEHPELSSLQQLIMTSARLLPLTREESVQYVEHKLRTAGAGETHIFTPEAIALIADNAGGNPRDIDRISLSAMEFASALQHTQVEEDDVLGVLRDPASHTEPRSTTAPGPILVTDATPVSMPLSTQPVTTNTWGSQALAVAPALEGEPQPVVAAATQEAAPEPTPPPPPIEFSEAVRSLRADLLDDAPVFRSTPTTRRISRSVRRIFLVTACVAGILVCAGGIVLLSRAAWKMIAEHRAAAEAEAENTPPADSTPAAATTNKSKHARSGKSLSSSSSGAQGSTANAAVVGNGSSATTQSGSHGQPHASSGRFPGYPRNVDEFRIPGMIIIPIPFERSPYAPPIEPATLQFRVEPIYPADAKAQRLEGTVKIRLHLDRTGHVSTVLVLSGDRRLAKPALTAVRQWVFSPFQESGAPFEGDTTVSLQFMAD